MRGPVDRRTLSPETALLVEEILQAMEVLTSAELQGDELAQRRAERTYRSLMRKLRQRAACQGHS